MSPPRPDRAGSAAGGAGRLILASASPRRHEALAALGVPFDVVTSDVESRLTPHGDPSDPVPVALAKAHDVAARAPGSIVLAGDTIVTVDGDGLGKPGSPEVAGAMLRRLRGRRHAVRTGLVVARDATVVASEVACPLVMRDCSDQEIDTYVASGEPLDCAGAYDVHRHGGALVERVDGCFSAVVGFPLAEAARLLAGAGVPVPRDPARVCTALYGRPCLAGAPATAPACRGAVRGDA